MAKKKGRSRDAPNLPPVFGHSRDDMAGEPATPEDAADEAAQAPADDDDYFGQGPGSSLPRRPEPPHPQRPAADGRAVRKTVKLENRKLTKKEQAAVKKNWQRQKVDEENKDTFWTGMVDRARRRSGNAGVLMADEQLVIAVPMFGGHGPNAAQFPGCLPMEFVIAQNGFPLCYVISVVGEESTGKSALLAEFGRWAFLCEGGLYISEVEDKFNPVWYRSIMGRRYLAQTPLRKCKSVEDWQDSLTGGIADAKALMIGTREAPGPGRIFPVVFGVDTIMSKQAEEIQEQILGKRTKSGLRGLGRGHAARTYPIEANLITKLMRTVPRELDEWPYTIVLINHLRIGKNERGHTERHKAGGKQVGFQMSFELELAKEGGKKKIECQDFEGFPVKITCKKSSFGTGERSIQTRVIWWYEKAAAAGGWEQVTMWDWDWSTVHLLHNQMHGDRANPMLRQSLKETGFHLEVPKSGEVDNLAWSKTLGMTKDDAAPWHKVGALIREDGDLMNRLRQALFIHELPFLEGDYLEQIGTLAEAAP